MIPQIYSKLSSCVEKAFLSPLINGAQPLWTGMCKFVLSFCYFSHTVFVRLTKDYIILLSLFLLDHRKNDNHHSQVHAVSILNVRHRFLILDA